MFTWLSFGAKDGRRHDLGSWPTLDAVLAEIQISSWEEPSRLHADCIMDAATGEVIAVLMFGNDLEVLVTCADGRRFAYAMPKVYREIAP